jgi:hypothetical protein
MWDVQIKIESESSTQKTQPMKNNLWLLTVWLHVRPMRLNWVKGHFGRSRCHRHSSRNPVARSADGILDLVTTTAAGFGRIK